MSGHAQPTYAGYAIIWGWLIALLAAGAYIPSLPLAKGEAVSIILFISLIKAALVTLFYMHLKFEKIVPLWIVAVFPFCLIGLAVALLFIGNALA